MNRLHTFNLVTKTSCKMKVGHYKILFSCNVWYATNCKQAENDIFSLLVLWADSSVLDTKICKCLPLGMAPQSK